jgi:hypothetical protein
VVHVGEVGGTLVSGPGKRSVSGFAEELHGAGALAPKDFEWNISERIPGARVVCVIVTALNNREASCVLNLLKLGDTHDDFICHRWLYPVTNAPPFPFVPDDNHYLNQRYHWKPELAASWKVVAYVFNLIVFL